MHKPHFYGFAAAEIYGDTVPGLQITDDGVFVVGENDRLSPAPKALLELAAKLATEVPVPASVSDRQFFQALYKKGYITLDELKAAVKIGDIPAPFQAIIDGIHPSNLPPGFGKDDIEIMVMGATVYERYHPVCQMIAAAFGWSTEDADNFWRYAASL